MIVDCAVYQAGRRLAGEMPARRAAETARADAARFVWIGLHDPDPAEFGRVADDFGLHPLAVEDALHPHQRPKLEEYGGTLFLVVKSARYVDREEVVDIGQVMVFVGDDFVVTVRHGAAADLRHVRQRLEARPDLLRGGPEVVLHAILDEVVDGYERVLAALDEDVGEVEGQVFSGDRGDRAERIYKLKREVLEFRRAVVPLADPVERLMAGRVPVAGVAMSEYFRDVHDHLLRVGEQVETFDRLLTDVLAANLAQVGVRQNEDMRRISAWVAILAVPTMVAGVYGMNFEQMPELRWRYGYPAAVAVMLLACAGLYRAFRRSGWL